MSMPERLVPTVEEALKDLLDWAEGRRSHTNTVMGLSEDRAVGIAAVAVADAMEVVKQAALVVALIEREKYIRGLM